MKEDFNQELKKILTGHYSCSRVWEAWQYGTMTQDDFSPLEEDENIYNDIKSLFKKWWINCSEKMPCDDEYYLVFFEWYIGTMMWSTDIDYWVDYQWERRKDNVFWKINYWMNLPDSPK